MRPITTLMLLTLSISPTLSWSFFPRDYEREHFDAVQKHRWDAYLAQGNYLQYYCEKYVYGGDPEESWEHGDPKDSWGYKQQPKYQEHILEEHQKCKEWWRIMNAPPPESQDPAKAWCLR